MASISASHAVSKFIPPPVGGLPVDTRIQDYRIKGVVGEGGFAIVYLADDVLLNREVALKEYMPAALAVRTSGWGVEPRSASHHETFAKGMRSFINEARLLAQFKHPALVDVLRFWEENGTAYMAMPYYRGSTLREMFRQSDFRCDESWLRRLIEPILSGLQAMHREKCFHRDISTDNIILLGDGNPILLDFGAARRIVAEPDQLATIILKPGFAPIEQYSDDVAVAPQGPWTDIYALCAVCYLAISGRMPTTSVARIMRDPVVPLVSLDLPGYSPKFLAAIDKGLAVRPEDRPQTINDFAVLINQSGPAMLKIPASPFKSPPDKMPLGAIDAASRERADSAPLSPRPLELPPNRDCPPAGHGAGTAKAVLPVLKAASVPTRRGASQLRDDSVEDSVVPKGHTRAGLWNRGFLVSLVAVLGFLLLVGYWSALPSPSALAEKAVRSPQESPQVAERGDAGRVSVPAAASTPTAAPSPTAALPQGGAPVSPLVAANPPLPTSSASAPGGFRKDIAGSGASESAAVPAAVSSNYRQAPSTPDETHQDATRMDATRQDKIEIATNNNAVTRVTAQSESSAARQSQPAAKTFALPRAEGEVGRIEQGGRRKGAVDLAIKPWGRVSVDGRSLGVAPPLRRISLPVGKHVLVLSHPNGDSLVKEITVVESGVVEVAHDFASLPVEQR